MGGHFPGWHAKPVPVPASALATAAQSFAFARRRIAVGSVCIATFAFISPASFPAYADCLPNPPSSGDTVTCTGPAPTTAPINAPAATNVTVNINSDATLTGSGALIILGTGAVITNNGQFQVISLGGGPSIGVLADSNSIVRNFGTMTTTGLNALSAVSIGDNVQLRNEQGGQINISGDLAAGLLIGLGNNSALTNAGHITLNTFQGGGLFAQEGSGHVLTNTATGIIESNLDQAFGMNGQRGLEPLAGDSFLLINEGTIITRGQASHGMLMNDLSNSLAVNAGSITTSGGSSETLNRAFGMFTFSGQGNTLLNTATGVINATGLGSSGMELLDSSGNLLRNEGTINVSGAGAHGMQVAAGGGNTLDNRATLNVTGTRGNGLRADDGGNTLLNSGNILVQGADAFGVFMQGTNNTLTNSGTIRATGNNADGVVSNTVAGSFVVTIDNSGSIISDRRFAVRGVNGQETLINSGLIRSDGGTAIDLRAGNDSVILRTGSQIVGLADGGTGSDRVVLEGSGTASNDFQNFETLRMTGTDWTWSGSGTFLNTQVESGVLRVAGSLVSPVSVQTGTTLRIGKGGATGTVEGDITDNGTVVFNRSNDLTYGGVLAGTGVVIQEGPGTLTLSASNSYSGGTMLLGGILAVSHDDALGAPLGALTFNDGTLQFGSSFDLSGGRPITLGAQGGTVDTQGFVSTVAQGITGPGGFTKTGTGLLDLAGASNYTGATTVQQGVLSINGSISSPTTVAAAGTLGGIGTIGNAIFNHGTVAPGNSIGTLTVANYFGQGGILLIETELGDDSSPSDKLAISGGSATGATPIQVVNVGGAGATTTGSGIPVVVTTNGGTTAANAFSLAGPVAAGPYEYLLFRGGVSPGTTQNWYLRTTVPPASQIGLPQPQPAPGSPPLQLPEPGRAAVPLYRPEVAVQVAVPGVAAELALATLGTFRERQGGLELQRGDGYFPAGWGRVFGQSGEQGWSGTVAPEFDGSRWGLQTGIDVFGVDRPSGHDDRFGVFFGHGQARGDVRGVALGQRDAQVGRIDLESNSFGAYWTHIGPSEWYVDGVLMHTWLDGGPRSDRGVVADVDSTVFTASLEAGYPFKLPSGWTVETQAQLIWQRLSLEDTEDRFSTIAYEDTDGFTGRLGVRLQKTMQSGDVVWQPWLQADLWRNWGGTDAVVFATTPIDTNRDSTTLQISAGALAQITDSLGIHASAGYITDLDDNHREAFSGNLGLRLTW